MDISFSTFLIALSVYLTSGAMGALCVGLFAMGSISRLREENLHLHQVLAAAGLAPQPAPMPVRATRALPRASRIVPALALLLAVTAGAREARAEGPTRLAAAPQKTAEAAAATTPRDANAIQYCRNIADAAADARFTRQKDALAAMEKEIEGRIQQLEAKRAEYEDWLRRREDFLKKADESLVAVVSQMRPDAAAAQMGAMNEDMAAALLSKLSPRVASAILNEIEPQRAARLTSTMVGLGQRSPEGTRG